VPPRRDERHYRPTPAAGLTARRPRVVAVVDLLLRTGSRSARGCARSVRQPMPTCGATRPLRSTHTTHRPATTCRAMPAIYVEAWKV
jgi:hypothetical protein